MNKKANNKMGKMPMGKKKPMKDKMAEKMDEIKGDMAKKGAGKKKK